MAKFCGNCGAPLNSTAAFCGGCGSRVSTDAVASSPSAAPAPGFSTAPSFTPISADSDAVFSSVPAAWTPAPVAVPVAPPPAPPVASATGYAPVPGVASAPAPVAYMPPPLNMPAAAAYPAVKSNTLLKLVVALVLIVFAGGALTLGGLWWAAQKIKAKAHEVAAQVMGDASGADSPGANVAGNNGLVDITGDPCRFLSKEEVGQAVGMPILRTEAQESGCSYIAKGDPADVTAKHVSAMLAGMGAGAQAQQMAQKFAGGLFAQQQETEKGHADDAVKQEIPVLTLAFTSGHAALEMKANRGAMEHIGATAPSAASRGSAVNGADLAGIGDEAYSAAGSMIMLRKGNVVARMMYVSCPCNTENIKPLARTLAKRL